MAELEWLRHRHTPLVGLPDGRTMFFSYFEQFAKPPGILPFLAQKINLPGINRCPGGVFQTRTGTTGAEPPPIADELPPRAWPKPGEVIRLHAPLAETDFWRKRRRKAWLRIRDPMERAQ